MLLRPACWSRELELGRPFTGQFSSLQKEMNQLMETFFSDFEGSSAATDFAPHVDIVESEGDFKVSAELPGLSDQDVEVIFEKGVLHITLPKASTALEEAKKIPVKNG